VNDEKYIGLDVHQATIVVAVMDSAGKLVMESILETEAATILQFFAGLRGTLSVTFEEGTWSAWLYDLLNPHVDKLVMVVVFVQASNGKQFLGTPHLTFDHASADRIGPRYGICRSLAVMACFRLSASSSRRACWRKCCNMSSCS